MCMMSNNQTKHIQSKVFSIDLTSLVMSLVAMVLDFFTVTTLEEGKLPIEDPYLSVLPWVVFDIDIFRFIIWTTC